ncbi:MAG: hypothetical protein A2Z18_04645 [Armatimonadetes bacterium RBG_16_58_9]|nr:MAG: hypothetical protein A2Z18_04645 [Armatimonadetes bacterium RBG_16_58_9]
MKLALYSLAVVLLVALHAELRPPKAPVESTGDSRPVEQTVFVDTAELVGLHPAWQALQEMETTLAQVGETSGGVSLRMAAPDFERRGNLEERTRTRADRKKLEEEVCLASESALRAYESDLLQALWLRMNARRDAMMEGALAGLAERFREINAARDVSLSAADQKYCGTRLGSRLAISALEVAAKSTGVDTANMEMELYRARKRLADIDQTCGDERQRAYDVAQGRIDALRDAEALRIDDELAKAEANERRRVEEVVSEARERLAGDLCSFEDGALTALAKGDDVKPGGKLPNVGAGVRSPCVRDLASLRAAAADLRTRIESDVGRTVRSLAHKQGVKLALAPSESVPDRTRGFKKLMLEHRWTDCGPVLSATRG